jgi:hypothetical protein
VCREFSITEQKQAVQHSMCMQNGISEVDQLVKIFIDLYQISLLILVILRLYINQIILFL